MASPLTPLVSLVCAWSTWAALGGDTDGVLFALMLPVSSCILMLVFLVIADRRGQRRTVSELTVGCSDCARAALWQSPDGYRVRLCGAHFSLLPHADRWRLVRLPQGGRR